MALPGFSTLTGRREEPVIPLIRWIRLCTPFGPIFCLATTAKHVGKQNGRSAIELPRPTQSKFHKKHLLIRGLRAWYGMANGPQLTTVPFSDKRSVRTSRQDRLLCLTLIVFSLSVPKQHEGHPNSSGSTSDSRVSRLKEVLQLPDGPKQG